MVQQIHPLQLAEKIQAGEKVFFLDVRQPWENEHCALPESLLLPLPELTQRLDELHPPEGALIVVYCHHGVRSLGGASIIQEAGFKNVASLWGGIEAWSMLVDPKVPRY